MKSKFIFKKMSASFFLVLLLIITLTFISTGCSSDDYAGTDTNTDLVGAPGNPRFNLQFSNSENVDLDLFVKTPNGVTVYYGNSNADGGSLDADCSCFDCPLGANENIFWQNGTPPSGNYEYWGDYFGSCVTSNATSNFTLRVLKNSEVVETRLGSLSSG